MTIGESVNTKPIEDDCLCPKIREFVDILVNNICTLYLNKVSDENEMCRSNPLYSKYCHCVLQNFMDVHSEKYYSDLIVSKNNGEFRKATHMDQIVQQIFDKWFIKDRSDALFYECFARIVICNIFINSERLTVYGNVKSSLIPQVKYGITNRRFHKHYDDSRACARGIINYVFKWYSVDLKEYLMEWEVQLGFLEDPYLADYIGDILIECGHATLQRWSSQKKYKQMNKDKFFKLLMELAVDYPYLSLDTLHRKLEYLVKHSLSILYSAVDAKYRGSVQIGIDTANNFLTEKTTSLKRSDSGIA